MKVLVEIIAWKEENHRVIRTGRKYPAKTEKVERDIGTPVWKGSKFRFNSQTMSYGGFQRVHFKD